jgi:hypothetical protein
MLDAEEGSAVDHGGKQRPAGSAAAGLRPDRQRTDLGLVGSLHHLAAMRPDLEHDRAGERAVISHGHQYRVKAVGAKLTQSRRIARIGRQKAVGQVSADSDIADLRVFVGMRVSDKHSVI